jgi:hypothetical protein
MEKKYRGGVKPVNKFWGYLENKWDNFWWKYEFSNHDPLFFGKQNSSKFRTFKTDNLALVVAAILAWFLLFKTFHG